MSTPQTAVPAPIEDHFRRNRKDQEERHALAVAKLLSLFRSRFETAADVIRKSGLDALTLTAVIEGVSRERADSEFVAVLRRQYVPLLDEALKSAGIDRKQFEDAIQQSIGVSAHDWRAGLLMSGGFELHGRAPEQDTDKLRREPPPSTAGGSGHA